MPIWIASASSGWDLDVYEKATRAVRAGRDPYVEDMAAQKLFYGKGNLPSNVDPPYNYVYPPITFPLLRAIGSVPERTGRDAYWLLYGLGVLAEIWVACLALEEDDGRWFVLLAPVSPFFPGLLASGIVLSGNIAYIAYPCVLLCAVYAWRRGSWWPFYLATLVAGCAKAPMLNLLLIPVLSDRRQRLPAAMTGLISLLLFAVQPSLWPSLFKHYLESVELQLNYNRDFGCAPAGLFTGFLHDRGIAYFHAVGAFYLLYAVPLLAVLLYFSRLYLNGSVPWKRWFPVLLTGVLLLNPRLIEYDVAPITLPLAMIGWRFLRLYLKAPSAAFCLSILFVATNCVGLYSWDIRKLTDGFLLVLFFLAGSWTLARSRQEAVEEELVFAY
jgi:hypothetical protein